MEKHKILKIISMWYNEEILAPFFLNHYLEFADKIYLIIDADTNDSTISIIEKYQENFPNKIEYEIFKFPDMMDDDIKVNKLNETAYLNSNKYDWICIVDADEFIFNNIKETIQKLNNENVIYINFYQVYRNIIEKDLNSNIFPIIEQRRYGLNKFKVNGVYVETLYRKPIVFKPEFHFLLTPGNHHLLPNDKIKPYIKLINGSHWMMADIDLAIQRRVYGRKNRQSKNNYEKGHTVQHWNITEEEIIKECKEHENDEKIF